MSEELNKFLQSNMLLVKISKGYPSFTKKNQQVAREVTTNHNAQEGSSRVYVDLLTGGDTEYKDVKSFMDSVYNDGLRRTLPFNMGGAESVNSMNRGHRLLPVITPDNPNAMMEFIAWFDGQVVHYKSLRDAFLDTYDQRKQEAIAAMGSLVDASMYPDRADLEDKFFLSMDVTPVPDITDFSRAQIPADLAQKLGERKADQQKSAMDASMADLYKRTTEELNRILEISSKMVAYNNGQIEKKPPVYKTLLSNIQGLNNLLEAAGGVDDHASALSQKIRTMLTQFDLEAMKNSASTPTLVLQATKDALQMQGGVTGTDILQREKIDEPDTPAESTESASTPPERADKSLTEKILSDAFEDAFYF